MPREFLGIGIALIGIVFLLEQDWLVAAILIVVGVVILLGTAEGRWSLRISDDSDGDGVGDGGD